jgi:hypothetical protein
MPFTENRTMADIKRKENKMASNSKFRPHGCSSSDEEAMPDDTALWLIRDSVAKRRGLIYGKLEGKAGEYCAIGAFWADHPGVTLHTALIDEVAAVNDSVGPMASSQTRWKKVNGWLRFKIKSLAAGA